MKKSVSNTARTTTKTLLMTMTTVLALSSGIVFSGSALSTQEHANKTANEAASDTYHEDKTDSTTETYLYPGMSVGAAAGTLIAGPVGLVVGGAIGAFIGSSQTVDSIDVKSETTETTERLPESTPENIRKSKNRNTETDIVLAQTGHLNSVIDNDIDTQQEDLMNILVSDLSLDVYFRSGSTNIEKFYPARLSAIANLVNNMDDIKLHLDGYADRRGNKAENIKLANERIDKVREQLIRAGVSQHRIVSKAFGEAKINSTAGNLEAYTFDRRVVIRFERINDIEKSLVKSFSIIDTAFDLTIDIGSDIGKVDTETADIKAAKQAEGSLTLENTNSVTANTNRF